MSAATEWYALVDGAADPAIHAAVQGCRDAACLFSGRLEPELAAAAPWLVRVDPREPLLPAWQDKGQGRHWGLLIEAALDLAGLRKLLRRSLQAKLPDGEVVLFRFYDPRVFRSYIVAASPAERAAWFDGVRQYAVEGEGGMQHSFRLRGGHLFDGDRPLSAAA